MGQIVEADLSDDTYFLSQIEHSEKLDRHDFYVDMVGGAEIQSEDTRQCKSMQIHSMIITCSSITIFYSF